MKFGRLLSCFSLIVGFASGCKTTNNEAGSVQSSPRMAQTGLLPREGVYKTYPLGPNDLKVNYKISNIVKTSAGDLEKFVFTSADDKKFNVSCANSVCQFSDRTMTWVFRFLTETSFELNSGSLSGVSTWESPLTNAIPDEGKYAIYVLGAKGVEEIRNVKASGGILKSFQYTDSAGKSYDIRCDNELCQLKDGSLTWTFKFFTPKKYELMSGYTGGESNWESP